MKLEFILKGTNYYEVLKKEMVAGKQCKDTIGYIGKNPEPYLKVDKNYKGTLTFPTLTRIKLFMYRLQSQ